MATVEIAGAQNPTAFRSREKVEVSRKRGFWEYEPFAGHPGSSPDNFVPVDWLVSWLAKILHVSDRDLIKRITKQT